MRELIQDIEIKQSETKKKKRQFQRKEIISEFLNFRREMSAFENKKMGDSSIRRLDFSGRAIKKKTVLSLKSVNSGR